MTEPGDPAAFERCTHCGPLPPRDWVHCVQCHQVSTVRGLTVETWYHSHSEFGSVREFCSLECLEGYQVKQAIRS